MTTPQPPRRIRGHALDLLQIIPAEGFTSEAALVRLAESHGIEVVDGRITGLRALRSSSAITIRRHPAGHLLYARTPTGTGILEKHRRLIA